jgi:hypothetical protein
MRPGRPVLWRQVRDALYTEGGESGLQMTCSFTASLTLLRMMPGPKFAAHHDSSAKAKKAADATPSAQQRIAAHAWLAQTASEHRRRSLGADRVS